MASLNLDTNSILTFVLRWTFAGLWATVGWAIATQYLLPAVPFL